MKKRSLYILAGLALLLLVAGLWLWHFNLSARKSLDAGIRQYEQLQAKLERYQALKRNASPQTAENEALFAGVNRIAAQAGVGSRLENLRPANGKEGESLDLQLRSLYLGETMRFISLVEAQQNVIIERLLLRRAVNNLLDLEMRIRRPNAAP